MTMLRSSSPAISEISVGSPSPPPPLLNGFHNANIKRLKPNVELHSSTVQFPPPPPLAVPQRRKSSAERVKSFSIDDILGKKEREEEKNRSSSPKPLPNPLHLNSLPANPALHHHLIQERLHAGLTVPAPLLMLDIPTLHKVIPSPSWDATGSLINQPTTNTPAATSTASAPTALPLHHFFPPALLHYEQRLAWDYQRQLQEHFQAQAQLLRQMSLDPNIIPSEDGSERSRSSSAGSRCYSPEVNVAGDDDEEEYRNPEAENKRETDKRSCITGDKNGKSNETSSDDKTKKSASDTPLDALFQLSTKNFDEDQDPATLSIFATRPNPKKKRKSRTAFTNHQIFELEKRFLYQKYLSPADRDEIAAGLGLSNAQVITWFQNRRAKLKRDMEELKKDVESVKQLSAHKSFLENVNDLSILKTRPVSRHQPPPPPSPATVSAVQHHTEIHTAAHTHGNHITAVYSTAAAAAAAAITDRRLHTEPNITVHIRPPQQQHHQLQQHTATATATTTHTYNERRDDSESSTESLQPQPNAAAEQQQQQQQQQLRNLQINHSRG